MHPNAYLNTFWRLELKPQIFVAMSFAHEYDARYLEVIEPAIETLEANGQKLKAYRVDISKSGDSILTDIMEGIAHSQMVLADVSAMGRDSKTSKPYRNGNVMYEVGIALACRQSEEVLLVRDDEEEFLFDVSTIPHMKLDFTDVGDARRKLAERLAERLRAQAYVRDARVVKAIGTLSPEELRVLKSVVKYDLSHSWGWPDKGTVAFGLMAALPRLLDKQMIRVSGNGEGGYPTYKFTPLGYSIAQNATSGLPQFMAEAKASNVELEAPPPPDAP